MPIPVQCQCGQNLKAPDNLAGKSALNAPSALRSSKSRPPGAARQARGRRRLPAPAAALSAVARCKPGPVICVACGFNTKTGKVLQSHGVHKVAKKKEIAPDLSKMSETERMLAKAEAELGDGPLLAAENYGSSADNWGLMFGCIALTVLIIGVSIAFFNFREASRTNYDPKDDRSQQERQVDVQRRIVGPVLFTSPMTVMAVEGHLEGAARFAAGAGRHGSSA